jgi:hypothetical protein
MSWSGQFNLDFMTFLGLSAVWVAWRHQFTRGGVALRTTYMKCSAQPSAGADGDTACRAADGGRYAEECGEER